MENLETQMEPLKREYDQLKIARDEYVISNYEAGDGFDDGEVRATKVVGFMRSWDVSKLEKLVPKGVLKQITELRAVPEKIDQFVKSGTLDLKTLDPAFTETPKKPYVKVSHKTQVSGESEAADLADKL